MRPDSEFERLFLRGVTFQLETYIYKKKERDIYLCPKNILQTKKIKMRVAILSQENDEDIDLLDYNEVKMVIHILLVRVLISIIRNLV